MQAPDELRALVERGLEDLVLSQELGSLSDAMRYALSGGGKRVRPILCLATAEAAGADADTALPAALALELVHTFSLVHDDLPAMDDDDERRGGRARMSHTATALRCSPATPSSPRLCGWRSRTPTSLWRESSPTRRSA